MLLAAIIPGQPAQIYVWETHDVFFFFFFSRTKLLCGGVPLIIECIGNPAASRRELD